MGKAIKVYAYEQQIFGIEPDITLLKANEMIDEMLTQLPHIGRPKVEIEAGLGFGAGRYSGRREVIQLSAHIKPHIVTHELAHFGAHMLHGPNMGHGSEWRDIYAHLLATSHGPGYSEALKTALHFTRPRRKK